jgi:ribosomal-protein-serine acetyltransferase
LQRRIDENLQISLFELNQAHDLFKLIDQNRDHFGRWLEFPRVTNTVEDTKEFIERSLHKYSTGNGFWCGIWHRNELIGAIGLLYVNWKDKVTEIGYYIAQVHEGKGYISRACLEVIEFIFNDLKLNRVEIRVNPENTRSCKIPERLGFKKEGILRQTEWFIDRFTDKVVYGLLKEDWEEN